MKTILFMCPHNAAKSLMAAAYFRKLAGERNLDWQILTAGTDPDDEPAAAVVALLKAEELAVPDEKPHRVSEAELSAADWIVSMGCELDGLAKPGRPVAYWDDIPPPSQDLIGARQAIVKHLEQFMVQLI